MLQGNRSRSLHIHLFSWQDTQPVRSDNWLAIHLSWLQHGFSSPVPVVPLAASMQVYQATITNAVGLHASKPAAAMAHTHDLRLDCAMLPVVQTAS
jgi:hypothetical protein